VIPILTPEQVGAVDRAAAEAVDVLVERAGFAVAQAARHLLGGSYGRRILVVAGGGNNGADGRVAARHLADRGARVQLVEASDLEPGGKLAVADLVIDAAFGTGLNRPWSAPDPGATPVLAVDIPSGLSGLTGEGDSMAATATVTFAGYKPGLLLGLGPVRTGRVVVAGIGLAALAAERAGAFLVEDGDLDQLPARPLNGHKWQTAVLVVGGSEAMNGAPLMVAHGAMRAGAGYALVGVPGAPPGGGLPPGEQVGITLPGEDWVAPAAEAAQRVKALAIGPGLSDRSRGPDGETGAGTPVARFLSLTDVPAVVDADAITALGSIEAVASVTAARAGPVVLTPHEGEFAQLTGRRPAADRITDVRTVARQTGAVVLLKGSTTVVADPAGRVLVAASGRPNLATAGTGDTLTGIIAAFMARGVGPLEAAALGAHTHGSAAQHGFAEGLVASDLPELVARFLSERRR
jgi:hydroxyethylthiazole kinase-like uncharacterized protein yjeF